MNIAFEWLRSFLFAFGSQQKNSVGRNFTQAHQEYEVINYTIHFSS